MSAQRDSTLVVEKSTLLGYELNPKQDIYVNYLMPAVGIALLYILHFTADLAVACRHFYEGNEVWASLTIFFMYLPIIGCFVYVTSAWELWPEEEGCGISNTKWILLKIAEHLFFPVWSMWRCAEKIFWSIEGVRAENDEAIEEIIQQLIAPRSIELYYFLQAYLQAAPQILLQLHVIMRKSTDMNLQTLNVQGMSMILSLARLSITTVLYQRFKTQKIGGKQYPWLKSYKYPYELSVTDSSKRTSSVLYRQFTLRRPQSLPASIKVEHNEQVEMRQPEEDVPSSRRSSDFYLEPTNSFIKEPPARETSVVGGPPRLLLRSDETDFFPRRLREIKGLPEDDAAGKMIAFFWWFCFLFARMLAISTFAYFYPAEIIWLLSGHFILVVALLLYDVKANQVRRAKAFFFIFIGYVYLFCLIEFKMKFKKTKFIYNGFFALIFLENFAMCFIWWFRNVDSIFNDWWYKYIFYMILGCSILSLSSMLFYFNILKPKKVTVAIVPA